MGDPRTCAILIPVWGSNWGSLGFSHNQNNHGSSAAYVTCIYCSLSVRINTCKRTHDTQRSWTYLYCVCFACVGGKNPKTPNLSPMADDTISQGDIEVWDLLCISVVASHIFCFEKGLYLKIIQMPQLLATICQKCGINLMDKSVSGFSDREV